LHAAHVHARRVVDGLDRGRQPGDGAPQRGELRVVGSGAAGTPRAADQNCAARAASSAGVSMMTA
jgi:hypothetical protein